MPSRLEHCRPVAFVFWQQRTKYPLLPLRLLLNRARGGSLIALSILMFIIVATGTYVANKRAEVAPTFAFANTDQDAMETPPVLDRLGTWAAIAIVLALLAYAGPMTQQLAAHAYLAPGMRTW